MADGSVMVRDAGRFYDAGPTTELFVATGHMGRSIISCDDGQSWVADESDLDAFRCFRGGGNPDGGSAGCDHNEGTNRGGVFVNGAFVSTFGYDAPGSVRRSLDGVEWSRVVEATSFAALVAGTNGVLLAASRTPSWSTDNGLSFKPGEEARFEWMGNRLDDVRFAASVPGIFAMYAEGVFGPAIHSDLQLAVDGGQHWEHVDLPVECGARASIGFSGGGGRLLYIDQASACVSSDGRTFTAHALPAYAEKGPMWSGTGFLVWGTRGNPTYESVVMRSPDGAVWSAEKATTRTALGDGGIELTRGPYVGPVARSADGTFVTVNSDFNASYERQQFYRSTDGATWDALPAPAFSGSHPLISIAWGRAKTPFVCR